MINTGILKFFVYLYCNGLPISHNCRAVDFLLHDKLFYTTVIGLCKGTIQKLLTFPYIPHFLIIKRFQQQLLLIPTRQPYQHPINQIFLINPLVQIHKITPNLINLPPPLLLTLEIRKLEPEGLDLILFGEDDSVIDGTAFHSDLFHAVVDPLF